MLHDFSLKVHKFIHRKINTQAVFDVDIALRVCEAVDIISTVSMGQALQRKALIEGVTFVCLSPKRNTKKNKPSHVC